MDVHDEHVSFGIDVLVLDDHVIESEWVGYIELLCLRGRCVRQFDLAVTGASLPRAMHLF